MTTEPSEYKNRIGEAKIPISDSETERSTSVESSTYGTRGKEQ